MLKNYFLVAWRHLTRNRLHSAINIVGLATGMTVTILIALWIRDELTFDHYYENHSRLAEIVSVDHLNGGTDAGVNASMPVGAALLRQYPEDIRATAVIKGGSFQLTAGNKKTRQWGFWAQSDYPDMFTLKMINGSREALRNPTSMLISQSVAIALFGDADAINKTILVADTIEMKVGGVYEDLPRNTSNFWISVLLPWDNPNNPGYHSTDDWGDHHFQVYVQLRDGPDMEKVSDKIRDLSKPHLKGGWETLILHPMDRWHLYTRFENGRMMGDRLQVVILFAVIGGFVLFLACINFMNLSTARSERRAKEVGIRKTVGSLRGQLIGQFLGESVLTAAIALLLALLMTQLAFPLFNSLSGKHLTIPWAYPLFWTAAMVFMLATGIIAGSYPALYLSGLNAVRVMKGNLRAGPWSATPRKALVVLQFTVSIVLIIATLVVLRQIGYAADRSVGYDREGLITVEMSSPQLVAHYAALRNDLLASGAVSGVAVSSSRSTEIQNAMINYDWEGHDPHLMTAIGTIFVDADYGRTIGWKIIDGRDFLRGYAADSDAFIINEAAVRMTGFKHPVGSVIRWHGREWPVIGVIKDMVMESPYEPAGPTFFTMVNRNIHIMTLRVKPGASMKQALAQIETIFSRYNPDNPFDYEFTDEAFGRKFADEKLIGHLATVFASLAIFISCLGLFGLASFVAEQRTREIGVRKILGASVPQLWGLLSREFLTLVIIACAIAIPLSGWLMHTWLQKYTYRTELSWWLFASAAADALIITLLTVSYQTVRAAMANPVQSLRRE